MPPDAEDRHAWERPGAHEVAPGVYRVPLPLPGDSLKAVNVYAIADGADRLVLVDGGWSLAASQEQLRSSLDGIGFGLEHIREFLVTHVHRDHYTQAVALRRVTGASVSLGEGERASLEAFAVMTEHPDVAILRAAGASELAAMLAGFHGERDLTDWEPPDRWLPDAVELPLRTRTLQVHATPGHTRGHVVFSDPEHDLLFSGDHVLPHITPSIGIEPARPPSPLRDYLGSLALIRSLPDATLLPAHGPVGMSVHDRIDELVAHHEQRLVATLKALDHGASTPFEVACALGWTRHDRRFGELDEFNQMLAVHETIAHLRVLAERDLVRSEFIDGVEHFAAC
ncbi:MAG: MBL fold metallo-hydrolase [Jatrophihabitans sp.]|nr:MAG: MBL fold metallo-hydrolase [Jatrophihabitans sp.]